MRLQFSRQSIDNQPLVDEVVRETRLIAPEEARHVVGPPAAVTQVSPAVARKTRYLVCIEARVAFDYRFDFGAQLRRHSLVRVEGKDPVVRRVVERTVLLRAEARPVRGLDHL